MGDHLFSDVHVTKNLLRWRTGLIVRELESEISATEGFAEQQHRLTRLMGEKERLEQEHSEVRLILQRKRLSYGPHRRPRNDGGEFNFTPDGGVIA